MYSWSGAEDGTTLGLSLGGTAAMCSNVFMSPHLWVFERVRPSACIALGSRGGCRSCREEAGGLQPRGAPVVLEATEAVPLWR